MAVERVAVCVLVPPTEVVDDVSFAGELRDSAVERSEVTEEQLREAAHRVEALPSNEPRVLQMRALVLGTALDWIADHQASGNHILGFPFTQHGLQLGVEASLRALARIAPTQAHRYALVDMANTVRPMSTF